MSLIKQAEGSFASSLMDEGCTLGAWLDQFVSDIRQNKDTINSKEDENNAMISEKSLLKELFLSFVPEFDIEDILDRLIQILRRAFATKRVKIHDLGRERATNDEIVNQIAKTREPMILTNEPAMLVPVFAAKRDDVRYILHVTQDNSSKPLFSEFDFSLLKLVSARLEKYLKRYEAGLLDHDNIPLYTLHNPFQVTIAHLAIHSGFKRARISAELWFGDTLLAPMQQGTMMKLERQDEATEFNEVLKFQFQVKNLSRGTALILQVEGSGKRQYAWTGCHLFTYLSYLRTGSLSLGLWKGQYRPGEVTTTQLDTGEHADSKFGEISIEFPSFERPVRYKLGGIDNIPTTGNDQHIDWSTFEPKTAQRLEQLLTNPLLKSTAVENQCIWRLRKQLRLHAFTLPRFIRSLDWTNSECVAEAQRYMFRWQTPTYVEAIQLLGPGCTDPRVRAYAVSHLHALPDSRLQLFLLQLVQALKLDVFTDSALSRFLLSRAILSPLTIGTQLFWLLKAEYHEIASRERYGLLLKQLMAHCGSWKIVFRHSMYLMDSLDRCAAAVKGKSSTAERESELKKHLSSIYFPESFQLPIRHVTITGIVIDACRVFDSKKKPLYIKFRTSHDDNKKTFSAIYKKGDDLRQDQITLQVLTVIDGLWKEKELDLCLIPYGCTATGEQMGMLECVEDATTFARVILESRTRNGKRSQGLMSKIGAARAALQDDNVILEHLKRSAGPTTSKKGRSSLCESIMCNTMQLHTLRENFARSCAGYCVATYVLGIGDRHNDNIMIQSDTGKMFHIDFGHFLGNFKKKLGIKRERAPFVFTPAMAAVLGGEDGDLFKHFIELATEAFKILRQNFTLLVALFSLMRSCGIPELQSNEDIKWVQEALMIEQDDATAEKKFHDLIYSCLNTRTTQMNDAVHMLAH